MLSVKATYPAHMSVPSNGMAKESSVSGSDSGPSTSSPGRQLRQSSLRGTFNPSDTAHGGDARTGGDTDGDGPLSVEAAAAVVEGGQGRRRHKSRKSSDFLLDSGPSSARRFPRYQKSRQRDSIEGGVGKGKGRNDELSVGKYRSPHKQHRQGLSLGSSPLATVTSASTADESPHSEMDRARFPRDTAHHEGFSPGVAHLHPHDGSFSSQHDGPPPSVGYDTDPSQIVNLALNLSESRKRHLPGRLPSRTISGGRKRNPTGQFVTSLGDRHHQDLPDESYVDHSVNNVSAIQDKGKRSSTGSSDPPVVSLPRSSPSTSGTRGFTESKDKYVPFELSDATISRAEKAKRHFELLYEYLRLLPHLPPLRRPSNKSSFISAGTSTSPNSLSQTRVYNPLQYIRNRKLRFREKCPIDTELGGWHEVENVHDWVDAVAGLDRESSDNPDEYLRLPPLNVDDGNKVNAEKKEDDNEIGSAASSLRRNNGNNSAKPRRPRMDWIFRPPDLLADAAWLEEGSNKLKIEDRDNNKIYPPGTDFKATGWQSLDMDLESSQQDEDFLPGGVLDYREALPSVQTGTSRNTKSLDRGRRRHKISRSIHLPHSRSQSSKAGKPKWRRALSRSSTSSNGSDIGSPQRRRKPGANLNVIDTALLEKQMIELQERGICKEDGIPTKPREEHETQSARAPLRSPPKLHKLITTPLEQRSVSLPPGGSPVSPALSVTDKDRIGRISLEDMDSTAPNSPSNTTPFPKITISLSPPVSRSSSPVKKPTQHITEGRHDRSKVQQSDTRDSLELPPVNGTSDGDLSYTKSEADAVPSVTCPLLDGSPKSKTHLKHDLTPIEGLQRSDSSPIKGHRYPSSQESRLRGIFKGGRIAEIVENEVSRVGDFIWKKDGPVTSQQSSAASSVASDQSDAEDEKAGGSLKGRPLAYFRRLPTFSEEGGRLSRKVTDPESSKLHVPSLPNFTSSLKQEDGFGEQGTPSQPASPVHHSIDLKRTTDDEARIGLDDSFKVPKINVGPISPSTADGKKDRKDSPSIPKGYGFGPPLLTSDKHGRFRNRVKDFAAGSVRSEQIPVTGLTNLEPSSGASQRRRPTLSKATRDWSISSRSITTTSDTSFVDKREIERVRALLLTSGIKAHEITRRAAEIRDPPPDFLLKSRRCSKDPIPRVTRAEEHIYATRNIDYALKRTIPSLQNSMNTFSKSSCANLNSELHHLEKIISGSLTQRTRAVASAAEDLCTELNTTSTLAVKQLNDSLDKGIRKRNRRLRWLRRVGFVILEWALVGIMWWVWLIVMVWKVTRGIGKGTVSGIRWILWL